MDEERLCNEEIPNEVRIEIAKNLSPREVLNLCQTNKRCQMLCRDDYFWKLNLQTYFGPVINQIKPQNEKYFEWYERYGYFLDTTKPNNIDLYTWYMRIKGKPRQDLLVYAAENGYTNLVDYIIKIGRDLDYDRALWLAIYNNHTRVAKHLLEVGARPNTRMLFIAAQNDNLNLLQYLIEESKLDPSAVDYTTIYEAIRYGTLPTVEYLIDVTDIDESSLNEMLDFARGLGRVDIEKFLLSRGATFN